jgi:hypothetical protein
VVLKVTDGMQVIAAYHSTRRSEENSDNPEPIISINTLFIKFTA